MRRPLDNEFISLWWRFNRAINLIRYRKCQALVFTPLKGLIFITRSILSFFFNAKLSLRDNGLIVFVTFHFLAGVICMIEAKNTKKNLVTVFWFGTSHFSN